MTQTGRSPLGRLRDKLRSLLPDRGGGPVRIRAGLGAGLLFDAGPSNTEYAPGDVEAPVQDALARHARAGQVVWDVGANVGFFTLLAARIVGPAGQVVAFEPVARNAALVRKNAAANALDGVTLIVEKAVDRTSGRARLSLAEHTGGAMLADAGSPPDATGDIVEVETVALDDYAAGVGVRTPNLVKIDVEGAEPQVLEGMRGLLQTSRPAVIFEVDDATEAAVDAKYRACQGLLEQARYDVTRLPRSYERSGWFVTHGLATPKP